MVDHDRLGGIAWLERTNGALTTAERRRLIRPILRGQAQAVAGRVALLTGRRRDADLDVPAPPDSAMAREAEAAAAAAPVVAAHRDPSDVDLVRDAISAHLTPGVTPEVDGPEAFYIQGGATLDLGGLRLQHLPASLVAKVVEAHPRSGLSDDIVPLIEAEAAAVPDGRFALLRRTGFTLAVRMSPLPG